MAVNHNINSIKIKQCRICGSKNIPEILNLGKQPLANNLKKSSIVKEESFPLIICFCENCKTIQLTETVDSKILFSEYYWVTGTSNVANEYSQLFFERSKKYLNSCNDFILEIASNDGTFLKPFKKNGYKVLGVDPAGNIAKIAIKDEIDTLIDFFGLEAAKKIFNNQGTADLIIARNVIPHVENIKDVIEGISFLLNKNGVGIIEFHRADIILDELHYDSIYHEHLFYYSITSLTFLLSKFNLYPFDLDISPISGGSFVIYFSKIIREKSEFLNHEKKKEMNLGVNTLEAWELFAKNVNNHSNNLLKLINGENLNEKTIIGYGASARSSTLLNFCDFSDINIKAIADKSDFKHGLFSPGTNIPIMSPYEALKYNPDVIILLAWNFKDEIIEELRVIYKWSGKIIIPLPYEPEIIEI